jgi:GT2 family glycosyltransferase
MAEIPSFIRYQIPDGIMLSTLASRPLLSTPQGARIALDPTLLAIWQQADGKSIEDILRGLARSSEKSTQIYTSEATRAALACLAEAGLLNRQEENLPPLKDRITSPGMQSQLVKNQGTISLVSIIIVDYNSRGWLVDCLSSIKAQTYQPLEVIIIDNGSTESSLPWLQQHFPAVKSFRLESTVSLAAAINTGVDSAQGDFFLILNPDVTLEPDAITQLVLVAKEYPDCAAVASKLKYSWAPAFLNGLGNRVGASFFGSDNAQGYLDLGQFDSWVQVPSACFAAALIPRSAWFTVGPLDEAFPIYYEDAEWSYRARLLGHNIMASPKAVVYHAFGHSIHTGINTDLTPDKLRYVIYGRLRFSLKLLSPLTLFRFLTIYTLHDLARAFFYLFQAKGRMMGAIMAGWLDFIGHIRSILPIRHKLQATRLRSDNDLFSLQHIVPPSLIWRGLPELTWDIIIHTYLPLILAGKTRPLIEFSNDPTPMTSEPSTPPSLLIISQDIIDKKMAGPGIRYLEMARTLSESIDVTLAIPAETTLEVKDIKLASYRFEQPSLLRALAEDSDILLISSFILEKFPFLKSLPVRRVIDLYDPIVLENLHLYQAESVNIQLSLNTQAVQMMNHLVRCGDFFICGNERQRDFWVGVLTSCGRINPYTFAHDASLRSLVDVVGVGFPDRLPVHHPFLRGVHPAFPLEAQIVLWGGGIWDWLDPLSLVRAWPQVLLRHPQARLVFLGTRHPNPDVPRHKMADATEALATEIGENGHTIFFHEWLSYEDHEALLCESDIGVALHTLHVETRYSIRTRVLDYLWAGLPVLVSDGDVTSEWVRQYQIGTVVPPMDVDAISKALITLLNTPKDYWQPAFAPLAQIFAWSHVIEPLKRYCLQGTPAADLASGRATISNDLPLINFNQSWQQRLARARYIWRTEGFRMLLHRAWRYFQWKLSR